MQAIEQGSQDWHSWRLQGIGGSDAPIILGHHDFGTPWQLWAEKRGMVTREPNEFIVQKGLYLEPKARACYAILNDLEVPPCLVQHLEIPWLRASLDGWNAETRFLLEIKYMGKDAHEAVKHGVIPEKYRVQMQHQFAASGGDEGDFLSCIEIGEVENKHVEIATARIHRDDIFIKKMIEIETQFWEKVVQGIPPEFVKEDFKSIRGKGFKKLFEEYEQLRAKIEALLPDEPRMRFGDVRMLKRSNGFDFRIENEDDSKTKKTSR
jgi:putative phage-type endonuclease